MRQSRKKGFTIVELVIVIAVIAVLATVLIPTFSHLTEKARLTADSQTVRQMTAALAMAVDIESFEFEDAINVLEAAKYDTESKLAPVTKNHSFYWYKTHNAIVLVNNKDNSLVFPDDETYAKSFAADLSKTGDEQVLFNLADGLRYLDVTVNNADELKTALAQGTKRIVIGEDIVFNEVITIPANADVIIDMAGRTLTSTSARLFSLKDGADLIIEAEGATVHCNKHGLINVESNADVTVVVNGGTYQAGYDTAASLIKLRPGGDAEQIVDITLNNVTYVDNSTTYNSWVTNVKDNASDEFLGKFNLTVKGGSYTSPLGFVTGNATFKDVTITTKGYAILMDIADSTATADGCTITTSDISDGDAFASGFGVAKHSVGEIKNSTITVNKSGSGKRTVAYGVYSTGGTLIANNNTVTADTVFYNDATTSHGATVGYIKIDGTVVEDSVR